MKIRAKVSPNAKKETIHEMRPGYFEVSVKEDRENGEANQRTRKIFADHFKVPISAVRIASGSTSPTKTIEILGK